MLLKYRPSPVSPSVSHSKMFHDCHVPQTQLLRIRFICVYREKCSLFCVIPFFYPVKKAFVPVRAGDDDNNDTLLHKDKENKSF